MAAKIEEFLARMRALGGVLDKGARGRQSFYREVDFSKNPGRACSWEKHFKYGSEAREVIGYLECLVEQFPRLDRFVFPSVDTIMEECFKEARAKAQNFSRRQFFNSMALFRLLGIVSPRIERDGHEGLIVAPHNALCIHDGRRCKFVGLKLANRPKQGLVGRFSMRGNGDLIWRPDSEKIKQEE